MINLISNDVKAEYSLSEATAWTFEIGYQCYIKKLSLDEALEVIKTHK